MNKFIISFSVFVFSSLGGYAPVLFGDSNFLDGWSILGGLIGGLFGVWLGYQVSKRF